MNWEPVIISDDPEWQEWHAEVVTPSEGEALLKVWHSTSGVFMAALVKPDGKRRVKRLMAQEERGAKAEALEWVVA